MSCEGKRCCVSSCNEDAKIRCLTCKATYYCCHKHLRKDKRTHKQICCPPGPPELPMLVSFLKGGYFSNGSPRDLIRKELEAISHWIVSDDLLEQAIQLVEPETNKPPCSECGSTFYQSYSCHIATYQRSCCGFEEYDEEAANSFGDEWCVTR